MLPSSLSTGASRFRPPALVKPRVSAASLRRLAVMGVYSCELAVLTAFVLFGQSFRQHQHQTTSPESQWFHAHLSLESSIAAVMGHRIVELPYWPHVLRAVVLLAAIYLLRARNTIYLQSFATFKPPEEWKVSRDQILEMMKRQNVFTDDSLAFMKRLLDASATGPATAWPPGIVQCLRGEKTDRSVAASREEAETIIYDVVERALTNANLRAQDIDVLVVNCSLFSPTPSLAAMVVTQFKMREDVQSFNLSGMGCGASLIGVDLARNVLRNLRRGGRALVVSTEIITPNLYHGNERPFLVQNTLFRCGGAAVVLSNKLADRPTALYKLQHLVRIHGVGAEANEAVYETEDSEGRLGVRLSKNIVAVAGKCMQKNLAVLGPRVLPWSEMIKYAVSIVARSVIGALKAVLRGTVLAAKLPVVKAYVPSFKKGIDHFCIHAGGRGVLDGIEKDMMLEPFHTEPSRTTLETYGNTSSSSIWYELEYIQERQKSNPLKRGHKVLQFGFGSGFKCTSAVWKKL